MRKLSYIIPRFPAKSKKKPAFFRGSAAPTGMWALLRRGESRPSRPTSGGIRGNRVKNMSLRTPEGGVAISQSAPECNGIATAGFAHLAMTGFFHGSSLGRSCQPPPQAGNGLTEVGKILPLQGQSALRTPPHPPPSGAPSPEGRGHEISVSLRTPEGGVAIPSGEHQVGRDCHGAAAPRNDRWDGKLPCSFFGNRAAGFMRWAGGRPRRRRAAPGWCRSGPPGCRRH